MAVVSVLVGAFLVLGHHWLSALGWIVAGGGALAALHGWRNNPWPRSIEGSLEVRGDQVTFVGQRLVARRSLRAGFLLPRAEQQPLVALVPKWPRATIELVVDSEPQGHALLQELGLDASQGVVRFHMERDIFGLGLLQAVVIGATCFSTSWFEASPWIAAMVMGAATFPIVALQYVKLVVGADGVLVVSPLRQRFIDYGELERVREHQRGIVIHLRSGESISFRSRRRQVTLVFERLKRAVEQHGERDDVIEAALPRRAGHTTAAWIQSLRRIGSGAEVSHRKAPVRPERLWDVVEDPSGEPAMRVGAAVVLSSRGDLDSAVRARLATAAKACASPRLRIALEAVADGQEPGIIEALEALSEPDEPTARTRRSAPGA